MTDPRPPVPPSTAPITSGGEFLLQVFRFLVGYGILFVCLILLLRQPAWSLSVVDAIYWGALGAVLLLGRRAAKAEQTLGEWARARNLHLAVACALWIGAQSVHLID
ncbi:MAG TPA: hypothetical protein VF384_17320 [Planctomycetota bacterium]